MRFDVPRQWEYFTGLTAQLGGVRRADIVVAGSSQLINLIANNPSTTATSFAPIVGYGGFAPIATESDASCVVPVAGTFKSVAYMTRTAPGAGKSYTITLRVNGADSALTFTNSGASIAASVTTDVAVSAGDVVSWKFVPSGTPSVSGQRLLLEFQPTVANQYAYFGCNTTAIGGVPRFMPLLHARTTGIAAYSDEVTGDIVALTAATIKALYVRLGAAPGVGKSYTVILMLNGAEVAASSLVISGASATGNLTGLSIALAQNDMVGFKVKTSAGAPAGTTFAFGTVIEPSADGQFQMSGGPGGGAWNSGGIDDTNYPNATTPTGTGEPWRQMNPTGFPLEFSNLTSKLVTAPGVGKSRKFENILSAGSTLTITTSGASTAGTDNGTATLPANGTFYLLQTPSGTPAASSGNIAVVCKVVSPQARLRSLMGVGL